MFSNPDEPAIPKPPECDRQCQKTLEEFEKHNKAPLIFVSIKTNPDRLFC
jgi:hypothetical protein